MFLQLISGFLRNQGKRRLSMAFVSMTVAAMLLTLLLSLSLEMKNQTAKLLAGFGPNLLVMPKEETLAFQAGELRLGTLNVPKTLPPDILKKIKSLKTSSQIESMAPIPANGIGKPSALFSRIDFRVKGSPQEISALASQLRALDPKIQTNIPLERVRAEAHVLEKTHLLMLIAAIIVIATAMLSVGSTWFAIILERQKEIGLMKALGATSRKITQIFLTEVSLLGLLSGVSGWILGAGLVRGMGRALFQVDLPVHPGLLCWVILLAWFTTLMSCLLPIRTALAIDPIRTLRGG